MYIDNVKKSIIGRNLLNSLNYFMCVSVLHACMPVYHIHAYCSWRLGDCVRFPGIGVKESCKSPLRC